MYKIKLYISLHVQNDIKLHKSINHIQNIYLPPTDLPTTYLPTTYIPTYYLPSYLATYYLPTYLIDFYKILFCLQTFIVD